MKATLIGLIMFGCTAAIAAEYPQLTAGMKMLGSASGALGKLERKTGPSAVGSAERIASVYEEMIGFWRQKDADDAVKWSEQGKAAAVQLENAANAGNADAAEAAMKVLSGTCQSCHEAYREKLPDGKYRLKTQTEK